MIFLLWASLAPATELKLRAHPRYPENEVWLSPDGNMAIALAAERLEQWDLVNAKMAKVVPCERCSRLEVSANRQRIAVTTLDGDIRIYNSALELEQTLIEHPDLIDALALSDDGRQLLSFGQDDRTAFLWSLPEGTFRRLSLEGMAIPRSADFSDDGRFFATANRQTGGWWDALTGTVLWEASWPRRGMLLDLRADAEGFSVAHDAFHQGSYAGPYPTGISSWQGGQETGFRVFHPWQENTSSRSTRGADLEVWDTLTKVGLYRPNGTLFANLSPIPPAEYPVSQEVFVNPSQTVALVDFGLERGFWVYDLPSGKLRHIFREDESLWTETPPLPAPEAPPARTVSSTQLTNTPAGDYLEVAIAPGGRWFLKRVGTGANFVTTLEAWENGKKLASWVSEPYRFAEGLAAQSDGSLIFLQANLLTRWDPEKNVISQAEIGHDRILKRSLTPDGQWLVYEGNDDANLYGISAGGGSSPAWSFDLLGIPDQIAVSADGRWAAVADIGGVLRILDTKTGMPLRNFRIYRNFQWAGENINYFTKFETLESWDLSGNLRWTTRLPNAYDQRPSPDGSRIAVRVRQGGVWVLDGDTGKPLYRLDLGAFDHFGWASDTTLWTANDQGFWAWELER